jgi:predicted ester cyclase
MSKPSTRSTKEVLRRNVTAVNSRNMEAYLANQQPDVEIAFPGGRAKGREQVRQVTEAMWQAFPDGQLTFGEQVYSEDAAAVEVIFTGTHSGPLQTPGGAVAPTGKRIALRSASILRIRDGLVAAEHIYGDPTEMMRQLGLMPSAVTP